MPGTAATRRTIDLQTLHQICERLTVRMLALQLRRFLPGCPVDRLDLALDASDGADVGGRAVDVQVTRLRRKLEVDPRNPRYLQTVRGVGYMLAPD